MKMMKLSAVVLSIAILLALAGCGGETGNSEEKAQEIQRFKVFDTIRTQDVNLTVTRIKFVSAVTLGTCDYDTEDLVDDGYNRESMIMFCRVEVESVGSKTYSISSIRPTLVAGDIRYDGIVNGSSDYYCVTTEDVGGTISPLQKKVFNYCIFNVPTKILEQPSLELAVTLDEVEYRYTVNR